MRGLNKAEIIGYVGADPDVHATADGTIRSRFNVAVNRMWNDANGQRQQETEWISCIAWGKVGEIVGEYVTKDRLLYVEGRLHTSAWVDETSGEKRYRTEVVAQEVLLLDSRRSDEATNNDEREAAPTALQQRPSSPQQHQGTQRQKAAPPRHAAAPDADEWGTWGYKPHHAGGTPCPRKIIAVVGNGPPVARPSLRSMAGRTCSRSDALAHKRCSISTVRSTWPRSAAMGITKSWPATAWSAHPRRSRGMTANG